MHHQMKNSSMQMFTTIAQIHEYEALTEGVSATCEGTGHTTARLNTTIHCHSQSDKFYQKIQQKSTHMSAFFLLR